MFSFRYDTTVTPAAESYSKIKMSFLDWLATEDGDRQERYAAYREYYDGNHDTQLTSRMREFLQIKYGEEFNTNYCPIVVDALAERLQVIGFEAKSEDYQEDDDGETVGVDQGPQFWDWWNANRLDAQQIIVHRAAIRDGDTYILVEWDDDKDVPVVTPELAYDGANGVKVHYRQDRRNEIEFASKRWRVEMGGDAGYVRRLNLYYPNRIERYISDDRVGEGNWTEYIPEGKESNIDYWTTTGTEGGEPLGVPVFHFRNNDEGYNFGKSELKDIVPLQNALNKSVIDLLAAADSTAFRIFTMIGDDPSAITIAPGTWIYSLKPPTGDDSASIGHIPGEDLAPMIALKDSFVNEIARVSRTPVSFFQTSALRPAEGTLKQEESGLLARVANRQVSFGNTWEDVAAMARKLNNAFGAGPEMDEDIPISTQWADAETRNEKDHIEAIGNKVERLQVPLVTAWAEAGYTPEEINRMTKTAEYQAAVIERLRAQFDAGEYPTITRWRLILEAIGLEEAEIEKRIEQMIDDAGRDDGFGFTSKNEEVEQ